MIIRKVPKSALYREVAARFDFVYQIAGMYAGQYICTDNDIEVMKFSENTGYLIDNVSICSSLPENQFVESINTAAFPTVRFRHLLRNELISAQSIAISQHYRNKQVTTHVIANRSNDGMTVEINGRFYQIPATIGLDHIYVTVSISTYQIDGTEYNEYLRNRDGV